MTDKPVRRRRAARVLVLDQNDRLLLLLDSELGVDPLPTWWMTPGGGIEGDEGDAEAAARELFEETGLRCDPADLGGPVWHRASISHEFGDHVDRQDEVFFVLRTEAFEPVGEGLTESEAASVLGHRWFGVDELAATADDIWPRELPGLIADVVAGKPGVVELPDAVENPIRRT